MLSLIYHGLGEAVSHPDYHGKVNEAFPSYYIIVWLVKLFPCLYHCHPDSDCPGDFPTLIRNAGLLGSKLSLPEARHVSGIADIFLSELALIMRTLVMAEI